MSRKITIEKTRDEIELSSELTSAISVASKNSGGLKGTRDGTTQNLKGIYALQDMPGKGKGLIAIKQIPKGTRILSEKAVITMEGQSTRKWLQTSICQQVETLSEHQRQAFLSMHNIHSYKNDAEQYFGIVLTNALPAELNGDKAAIFLEACRINHACDNNAQKNWNERIKRHTVHALRNIEKGEEITITYLSPLKNRKTRQKVLQEKFAFTCSCRLCCLPPDQSRESDKRLEEIDRLDYVIELGARGILVSPLRTLRYLDQQVRLYNKQEREDVGFAHAYVNAARLVIANGDLARGRIFANRAVFTWRTTLGSDSQQVIDCTALAEEPSKDEQYGLSMKWSTTVDEFPRGLGPTDFENWLWKREKPQPPRQLADLRSRNTFPGFNDLPDEKWVDLDFYKSSDRLTHRPRRHWCFLGEILDFSTMLRLQMEIEDVDGVKIPLYFYNDTRGSELAPSQVQRGYTVAILYAKRHAFVYGEPGIRHEDPLMIKIFPMSLHKLLWLNDRVQQFSMESDGIRMCHGCGKKAASLLKCAKCSTFWYCNHACQVAGWKEKGHKADCNLLKDLDLRGLFLLKWDEFENHVQFPLQVIRNS